MSKPDEGLSFLHSLQHCWPHILPAFSLCDFICTVFGFHIHGQSALLAVFLRNFSGSFATGAQDFHSKMASSADCIPHNATHLSMINSVERPDNLDQDLSVSSTTCNVALPHYLCPIMHKHHLLPWSQPSAMVTTFCHGHSHCLCPIMHKHHLLPWSQPSAMVTASCHGHSLLPWSQPSFCHGHSLLPWSQPSAMVTATAFVLSCTSTIFCHGHNLLPWSQPPAMVTASCHGHNLPSAMVTAFCHGHSLLPWSQPSAMVTACCHGHSLLPWSQPPAMVTASCHGHNLLRVTCTLQSWTIALSCTPFCRRTVFCYGEAPEVHWAMPGGAQLTRYHRDRGQSSSVSLPRELRLRWQAHAQASREC